MARPPVAHHADIPETEVAEGSVSFRRRRLGRAAGARRIGAGHFVVGPGAQQMPVHVHGEEEEIFYVLAGTGIAYEHEGQSFAVSAGDVVVHRPQRHAHTFLAGDNGLELIAFGSGSAGGDGWLPRAGVMWCGPHWVPVDAPHPFTCEADAGPLEPPAFDADAPRPAHVVALDAVDAVTLPGAIVRCAGAAAGSQVAGLNHVRLQPGARGAPPHCHSSEEELFIVLEGIGTLTLGPEEHPLAPGDVVARPPGTAVAHSLVAGPDGLVYLAYGTREPGDAILYPEVGEIRLRGLGVSIPAAG